MAIVKKTKKGNKIVLRNPSEKAKRFVHQLRNGEVAETGKKLSEIDKGFRRGYLAARSDNAQAYLANEIKKAKKEVKEFEKNFKPNDSNITILQKEVQNDFSNLKKNVSDLKSKQKKYKKRRQFKKGLVLADQEQSWKDMVHTRK